MIALALKALGLMRVSEHERITSLFFEQIEIIDSECDDWEAKFKRAATDLAAQAEEREGFQRQYRKDILEKAILRNRVETAESEIDELKGCFNQRLADAVQDYQGDAQKWRNSLKRSRDRKAAKNRGGGK